MVWSYGRTPNVVVHKAFLTGINMSVTVRHFNTNAIYNMYEDGSLSDVTTKYVPEDPVPNVMLSACFDPSVINEEPKYQFVPFYIVKVMF